jgi:hypothetical protein
MYLSTTASSIEDLIDQIADAALAAGWTVDRNNLVSTNRTVTVHKSGDYIHIFNTDQTGFSLRASTGYSAGDTPAAQPGASSTVVLCNVGDGPFGDVHFFADDDPAEHFFGVVNIDGERYRHFAFGELVKAGTYTGGTFFDAINWTAGASEHLPLDIKHHQLFSSSSYDNIQCGGVRCDLDGNTDFFAPFRDAFHFTPNATGGFGEENTNPAGSYGDAYRTQSGFYNRSINGWTGRTPFQHVQIRVQRPDTFYSIIGEVPNIRYLYMSRFVAGEEVTIGSDTWKIFPWIKQGGSGAHSAQHAFAYKKVA